MKNFGHLTLLFPIIRVYKRFQISNVRRRHPRFGRLPLPLLPLLDVPKDGQDPRRDDQSLQKTLRGVYALRHRSKVTFLISFYPTKWGIKHKQSYGFVSRPDIEPFRVTHMLSATSYLVSTFYLKIVSFFIKGSPQGFCLHQGLLLSGGDHGTDRDVGCSPQLRIRQAGQRRPQADVNLCRVLHYRARLRQFSALPQPQFALSSNVGGNECCQSRGRGQRRRRLRSS